MFNRIVGVGVIALVMLCARATAQTTLWQNPAAGSWFEPANWSAGAPAAGSFAVVNNGGRAQIGAGAAAAANVVVGSGATGLLDLSGGSLSVGSMLIGHAAGGAGTFTISGGQLLASAGSLSNAVGNAGAGWWIQSGGDVLLQNNLNVGSASSGAGTAQITGGSFQARAMSVGLFGAGTVLHSGGTVTIAPGSLGTLTLGSFAGATGYYRISGTALLSASDMRVGRASAATFEQAGGTVQVARLNVGSESGGSGHYVMSGGTLIGGVGIGGFGARGRFEQFGGVVRGGVSVHSDLPGAEAAATYDLHDGLIDVGGTGVFLSATGSGAALFRQHGGVVRGLPNDSDLNIIGDSTGRTRYEMTGGSLEIAHVYIGEYGTAAPRNASFRQSAGDVITNSITLANGSWEQSGGTTRADLVNVCFNNNSRSTYYLNGGSVQAGSVLVAHDNGGPAGTLSIGQGTLTAERLRVSAPINLRDGYLLLNSADSRVIVSDELSFGTRAHVSAVPGATIHMNGAILDNRATDAAAMAGLNNIALRFSGEVATIDQLEVASRNLGPVLAGFDQNFALGELSVSGVQYGLRLADAFDNLGDVAANEHLYVRHLAIGPNTIFDLSGRTVYYLSASIDPTATIFTGAGGQLVAVPEPSPTTLAVAAGVLVLIHRCRRDERWGKATCFSPPSRRWRKQVTVPS